ncbi:MAG TPA: hypothetical protein VFW22_07915 [Pseudolabrys sp.]|nr:hypothetical protein [Pseudolabrys sp.]
MTDLLFDKLAYKDKLTASGIPEAQARAHADAMDEALRESVATKSFVTAELTKLKLDLTIRMGVIAAAAIGILASVKYFG